MPDAAVFLGQEPSLQGRRRSGRDVPVPVPMPDGVRCETTLKEWMPVQEVVE
jgi:hypothetical protein